MCLSAPTSFSSSVVFPAGFLAGSPRFPLTLEPELSAAVSPESFALTGTRIFPPQLSGSSAGEAIWLRVHGPS
ncbi:hypothetical protein AWENTII_001139 [Aspergillus wentii]